jgi:hypothetical protein
MFEIIIILVSAAGGSLLTLYLVKNDPERLERWIAKLKDKANKL